MGTQSTAGAVKLTKAGKPMPPGLRPWTKGQSGNPGGRSPSLRKGLLALLRESMKAEDPVTGKKVTITKQRAILDSIFAEALGGKQSVQAFKEIRDTVDGRPVSSDEQSRADQERAPTVTVNILTVLGEFPKEALLKLRQAAIEAQAVRVLPRGDDDEAA